MSANHQRSTHSGCNPSFEDLGVAIEITEALAEHGIHTPFAIQEFTLPIALNGKDLIGQARTGTGKTFGFGVPLLDRVFDDATITAPNGQPRALVVVPTRELCLQVTDDLVKASANLPLKLLAIYGGVPFESQVDALKEGTDVLIGTPGRLLDLHRRGDLELGGVEIVVLDEADEMLDQGFIDDVTTLIEATSPHRQTMLFSATLPDPILALSREFMKKPVMIQADDGAANATHETTRQIVFQSHKLDRLSALARILQSPERGRTIVFSRTKRQAAFLALDLANLGFAVGAVHGDMRQPEREEALAAFRMGTLDVMVATDVAARGIDVEDVTHVINYQVPEDERTYVHRIGRTGRAGHTGTAVTLVGWDEVARWQVINDTLGLDIAEPPQWFSSSPEFLKAFNLPEGISDRVGSARRVKAGKIDKFVSQPSSRKSRRS